MKLGRVEMTSECAISNVVNLVCGEQEDKLAMWLSRPKFPATLDSANFYRRTPILYKNSDHNVAGCPGLELIEPHYMPHEFEQCALKMDSEPNKRDKKSNENGNKREKSDKPDKPDRLEHICALRA